MSTATMQFTVTDADTATALGSGALAVLGTPRLLAWCEAVTCAAIAEVIKSPTQASVGTRVELQHTAPCGVGATVSVTATAVHDDGRLWRFAVQAIDQNTGKMVGVGEITRVVVEVDRFLKRLN
jgi:fluoroacetyl-CoA thioesterase